MELKGTRPTTNEISTITGRPPPTTEDEFAARKGLARGLAESLSYLDSGPRGPEWQMGYISPPGIRSMIPESTRELASLNRRGLYLTLNENFSKKIKDLSPAKKAEAAQNYADQIRAITALPDGLVARMRRISPETKKDWGGSWSEFAAPKGHDVGGRLKVNLAKPEFLPTVIRHELGGHALHGVAKRMYDSAMQGGEAFKQWLKMPNESREAVRNLTKIDKFSRRWHKSHADDPRYIKNYDRWPGELFSHGIEDLSMDAAETLGRRLTMDEYLKMVNPVAKKWQTHTKNLDKEFAETEWKQAKKKK